MKARIIAVALATLIVGCVSLEAPASASPTEAPTDERTKDDDVPRASCDAPVGGIKIDEGIVEAEPDYDARLAAIDTSGLPASLDISAVDGIFRAVLAYTLEIAPEELGGTLDRDALRARGRVGDAVLAAFASEDADPLDFALLRQGLHRFYACDRRWPLTLDGFKSEYVDFEHELTGVVIEDSRPKRGPRRLFEDHAAGIFVAETIEGDAADGSVGVRETEVVLSGARADGMLDFIVYDERGDLSAASRFATNNGGIVNSASPYTCLFCHGEPETLRFDVVHPD